MTEFEINKKVAQKLGLEFNITHLAGERLVKVDGFKTLFDPCNNAEQAWKIMLNNDICVTRGDCEDYNAFRLLTLDGYEWFTDKMLSHPKPFVAVMLLFLELD